VTALAVKTAATKPQSLPSQAKTDCFSPRRWNASLYFGAPGATLLGGLAAGPVGGGEKTAVAQVRGAQIIIRVEEKELFRD
jgi:hypothetical protein